MPKTMSLALDVAQKSLAPLVLGVLALFPPQAPPDAPPAAAPDLSGRFERNAAESEDAREKLRQAMQDGRLRTLHPDGKAYEVETKSGRGPKLSETWSLDPGGRLRVTTAIEGGSPVTIRSVYDRASCFSGTSRVRPANPQRKPVAAQEKQAG